MRRQMAAQEAASLTIQATLAGHQARKEATAQVGDAASHVQAAMRGAEVRKQIAAQDSASLGIQASIAGYEARKEVAALYSRDAAYVQGAMRGAQVRKQIAAGMELESQQGAQELAEALAKAAAAEQHIVSLEVKVATLETKVSDADAALVRSAQELEAVASSSAEIAKAVEAGESSDALAKVLALQRQSREAQKEMETLLGHEASRVQAV